MTGTTEGMTDTADMIMIEDTIIIVEMTTDTNADEDIAQAKRHKNKALAGIQQGLYKNESTCL